MGLIDIIKSILTFNKKPARIIVEDLTKTNGESTPLEIGLYSEDTPLTNKTLIPHFLKNFIKIAHFIKYHIH